MSSIWSDEIVNALKELAAQGLSASQCASHFNGMSRNAAVGLAFRKGFHFLGINNGSHHHSVKTKYKCAEIKVAPDIPVATTLALEELKSNSCRYIFGDVRNPNHRYCGAKQFEGYSWCAEHCMVVFDSREARHAAPAR